MTKPWPTVRLGEVLSEEDTSVPVSELTEVNLAGVYSFARGLFKRGPMSPGETSYKTYNRLARDDFVISTPKAWEGALARVTPEFEGWFLSPVFPTFRANRARLEPAFLEWFCKRESVWTQLQRKSRGIGARRESVHPEQFLSLEIPLPPLAEQRRVVARIEELAAQIHEARTLRHQAAEEAQALVHANRNRSFHELSSRCSSTQLDSVTSCRLGKMLDPRFKTGIGSTPYLRNANVQWDRLDLNDVYQMDFKDEERTEFALQSGDILVCEGGDIGKAAIWNDEIPGCCYQKALHRVRCDRERALPRFIIHHLFWAANQGHWQELKTQTTIPHLTGVKLKAYQVFVPPLPEQRRIVAELDKFQAEVDALKRLQAETATELDSLLPAILDRAFKGEV